MKSKIVAIIIMILMAITFFCMHYFGLTRGGLSCKANVNLYLSSEFSDAPVINGVLSVNLKQDGYGIAELDGVIDWKGKAYPVSKFIKVKHDLTGDDDTLFTVSAINIASREHDKSPIGIVEKFIIGDPDLPERIFNYRRVFENGYLISNLNSPIAICIER
ncbi:hypothetical protein [Serratia fonticola]|uniref:hypothetical protein n=1 Tax=Serratia fonticola TaxID=47917 RepID=UPI003AF3DF94